MKNNVLYSSDSILWGTDPELFKLLNSTFQFQLDPASNHQNHLCPNYFTEEDDGLAQDWHPYRRIWLNPPFGKTISLWMKKAYEESQKGCLVVCLVPARVDTRWWHDWVKDKAYVQYPKGRLKYLKYSDGSGDQSGGAPFASAIVIYGPDLELRKNLSANPIEYKSLSLPLEHKRIFARNSSGPRNTIRS